MRFPRPLRPWILSLLPWAPWVPHPPASAQEPGGVEAPFSEDLVFKLVDEVSGQVAFDNMVRIGGAPWQRTPGELRGETNFYESEELYEMVRAYGIETVRLERYGMSGSFFYPTDGEVRVNGRMLARLPSDPALIARGSRTGEASGPLIYVPQTDYNQVSGLREAIASAPERYRGAIALMWTHPGGALFEVLDQAGVRAVIAFNSRERYFDPDQVLYAGGSYARGHNLRLGFTVSWRQWSELLEDVERGEELSVDSRAVVDTFPDRMEAVYAWIPGTEPELPGVIYTGHLFEGYTKRGTNDNVGGPAVELEILRSLHRLIQAGELPRPRRSLYFVWPQEISGMYEFLRRHPDLAGKLAININMDMVSEGLRRNNAQFAMSETPAHLASFYDGLADAVMDYLWQTNDVAYPYHPSPRDRSGGQYFQRPLWEKNGTRDAFRFYTHDATGGSDHICFNNPSVGVPGIQFFVWPDQWYHADRDVPRNADPTQMRRVAFVGAITGWISANLSDEMVSDLLDAVSDFGYSRFAERVIPRAMDWLDRSGHPDTAWYILSAGLDRELDAIRSVLEISTGSARADSLVEARLADWEGYRKGIEAFYLGAMSARGFPVSAIPEPSAAERAAFRVVPDFAEDIRSKEFFLMEFGPMREYEGEHPGAISKLGLSENQITQILDFVDGRRSVGEILSRVRGVTAEPLTLGQLQGYLAILQEVGWLTLN